MATHSLTQLTHTCPAFVRRIEYNHLRENTSLSHDWRWQSWPCCACEAWLEFGNNKEGSWHTGKVRERDDTHPPSEIAPLILPGTSAPATAYPVPSALATRNRYVLCRCFQQRRLHRVEGQLERVCRPSRQGPIKAMARVI